MKVITNTPLAAKRRRQAIFLSVLGTAILVAGLVLNFQGRFGLAYASLLSGTLLSWAGVTMTDRWVAMPRPESVIGKGLAAQNARAYALYHWALPADHVFVSPWGLTVFFVHNHDGPAEVEGARWRDGRPLWRRIFRFARRPVRHPGVLLELDLKALREKLVAADPSLAEIPIEAVALFSNPKVKLHREDPDMEVLLPAELEAWARRSLKEKPRIAPADRLKLETVLDGLTEGLED
jgi:hypothetical protein